ncbi:MAG: YqeG family HAD IIIA-type phosphatase [Actinobacteria bacterium]|nr:YqeG family HAD IIIA-type phosphatase [Actinomycetota bacterium]
MKSLAPQFIVKDISYITDKVLKELSVSDILLDIDNTIVERDKTEVPQKTKEWILSLKKKGYRIFLVSNSLSKRANKIARDLYCDGLIAPAGKPFLRRIKKLLRENRIEKEKAVVIGDQVFTDLLMSKRLGIRCILVLPLSKSDLPHTKLLRLIEGRLIKNWINSSSTIFLGEGK